MLLSPHACCNTFSNLLKGYWTGFGSAGTTGIISQQLTLILVSANVILHSNLSFVSFEECFLFPLPSCSSALASIHFSQAHLCMIYAVTLCYGTLPLICSHSRCKDFLPWPTLFLNKPHFEVIPLSKPSTAMEDVGAFVSLWTDSQ